MLSKSPLTDQFISGMNSDELEKERFLHPEDARLCIPGVVNMDLEESLEFAEVKLKDSDDNNNDLRADNEKLRNALQAAIDLLEAAL